MIAQVQQCLIGDPLLTRLYGGAANTAGASPQAVFLKCGQLCFSNVANCISQVRPTVFLQKIMHQGHLSFVAAAVKVVPVAAVFKNLNPRKLDGVCAYNAGLCANCHTLANCTIVCKLSHRRLSHLNRFVVCTDPLRSFELIVNYCRQLT